MSGTHRRSPITEPAGGFHKPALAVVVAVGVVAALAGSIGLSPVGAAEPLSRDQIYAACAERLAARPTDAWLRGCVAAMAPDATSSATPTASPTGLPSTPSPSETPPGTSTPPPTTSPPASLPAGSWPTPITAGVPKGWQPTATRSTDLRVTQAGAVIQDLRLTNGADILVDAPGVTIRRVELQGGRIDLSPGSTCNRTRIEQVTIRRPAGTVTDADQEGRITPGGWIADRIHLDGVPEGLRAGGKAACGANSISDSFIRVQAPDVCADWHGDGIQGYDGGPVAVRNTVIDFQERSGCGGTAPFFYPHSQGNTSIDVDRLIVRGGGFPFRNGMPGRVTALHIVDGSWSYGPISVRCSAMTAWQASISRVAADWTPTVVRAQPCNTNTGN